VGGALTDAVWIFAAVLVLIILAAAVLASRRYLLERSGGTVECALRWPAGSGAWRLGVLSYQHDSLRWHGALGVLLRPEYVFHRRALSVLSRRPADPSETVTLGADRIVVEVSAPPSDTSVSLSGDHVELAMTEQALTGFLAWLEASPPGSHLGDFSLNQNPGQLWVAGRGGIALIAKIPGIAEDLVRYSAPFLTQCPNLTRSCGSAVAAWAPEDVSALRVRGSGQDEQ
jgi:Protein of unknown function (DUF2550)